MTPASVGPAGSSAVDFGIALRRAQHLLALRVDDALSPMGLNLGLWRVLHELGGTPGASASELGRASFHTPQTVGGLLRRLQDQGLVERTSGRGRIVDNQLTRQGAKVLRQATATVDMLISGTLAHIDDTQVAHASQFLAEYVAVLSSPPEGG